MSKAFVTYNQQDSDFMNRLVDDLENKAHLNITFDKRILGPGSETTDLFGELGTSDFCIAIMSKHSINSAWCQKEIRVAINKELKESNFTFIAVIPPGEDYDELQSQMDKTMSTMLLDKFFARFDVNEYENALRELIIVLTERESSEKWYSEIFDKENPNPFWRVRAENYLPESFVNLFKDPEETYDKIRSPRPTMIEGGRGSGKTMLLKSVQASLISSIHSTISLSDPKIPYFGVYLRAAKGTFTLTEKTDAIDYSEKVFILMDQIILRLGQSLLSELKYCRKNNIPKTDDKIEEKICKILCRNLRLPNKSVDFESTGHQIRNQIRSITDYVRTRMRKTQISYSVKSLETEDLDLLCKEIIEAIPELKNKSICFLVDEYENFTKEQKIVLNTLIKFHDSTSYSFKIAGKKTAFNEPDTLEGQSLQKFHDYDPVDLDFDISKPAERTKFENYVLKICEKIMKDQSFSSNRINEILEDRTEYFIKYGKTIDGLTKEQIMNEIKRLYTSAKIPWEKLTKDSSDYYYNHYGISAEFRLLKSKPKSYAGFDDLVTFSSGNLRTFIELCGLSYILATNDGVEPKKGEKIPFRSQTKAIENISEHYLWDIEEISVKGKALQKFVSDLGSFIREKLITHFHEPESTLLSITNTPDLELKTKIFAVDEEFSLRDIIDTCIMHSIFHEYGVSKGRRGKSGYGVTTEDFILNRIFAQTLKISPRPMSSFTISSNNLKKLLDPKSRESTRKSVIDKIRKTSKTQKQNQSLDFFDDSK